MSPAFFTDLAEDDLRQAYEWYEARNTELALKFMIRVRETVDAIEANPKRFSISFNNICKAGVAKFPFAIWYISDGDSLIIACIHQKRMDKELVLQRSRGLGPKPE